MPKNPLRFARRKSTVAEDTPITPSVSSFRVLERPEKINLNGDDTTSMAARAVARPFGSPLASLQGSSTDRLDATGHGNGNLWPQERSRASGGTMTSASSGYFESSSISARHSSTSTLPSSIDAEREADDEELFPSRLRTDAAFEDVPLHNDERPARPASFTPRSTRAMTATYQHNRTHSSPYAVPSPPSRPRNVASSPERKGGPLRERATTTSSYASTAKPEVALDIDSTDFANAFDSRFGGLSRGDGRDASPDGSDHRTESEPLFPPRTHSGIGFRGSPDPIRDGPGSPYAWDRRNSRDQLLSRSPRSSPTVEPPAVPLHRNTTATAGLQSNVRGKDTARVLSQNDSSDEEDSLFDGNSRNATPRAARWMVSRDEDASLLGSSPLGPPSRAMRPQHARGASGPSKRMTKAQFETLQRQSDSGADQSGEEGGRLEADDYEDEEDLERARQTARQRERQEANMSVYRQQMKRVTGGGSPQVRPSFDRASASAPAVGSAIYLGGINGKQPADAVQTTPSEDEDEDVPLGILQAHGFPRLTRPASRSENTDPASRRSTPPTTPGLTGGPSQGSLPPFARKLPADPYHGTSSAQSTARESLAFTSTPSVYGGLGSAPPAPTMGHPGGLVGVIAGEERAKAARRGSSNFMTGAYGSGLQASHTSGMPGMGSRAVSMGNVLSPQTYMPSGVGAMPMMGVPNMQQMPMMPIQSPEQMQQFMEMQMQFMQNMQNMLAMQQQQQQQISVTPPPEDQQPQDLANGRARRHSTATGMPSLNGGRAMSMMAPANNWNVLPGRPRPHTCAPAGLNIPVGGLVSGYTPSIAPSERSNVGMPSRYRPVTVSSELSSTASSVMSQANDSSYSVSDTGRSSTGPQTKATIRAIDKPKGSPKVVARSINTDEEDDEGWAKMQKRREEKKRSRFSKKGGELSTEQLMQSLR